MDNPWLLLLLAGLVVGIVFIGGSFIGGTRTLTSEDTKPQIQPEQKAQQPEDQQLESNKEGARELTGKVESLDFKVDVTNNGRDQTYRFRINNPETENEDVRIDQRRADGSEFNLILRHGRDEGWIKEQSSNTWKHFTGFAFTQMARTRAEDYSAYQVTNWKAMEGETFTVDTQSGNARVYDVRVNDRLPESVFTPD